MSEKDLWTTINRALTRSQRIELNAKFECIKSVARSLMDWTSGQESPERDLAEYLKILTSDVPFLVGSGTPDLASDDQLSPDSDNAERLRRLLSGALFMSSYGGSQNVGRGTRAKFVGDEHADAHRHKIDKIAAELIIDVHSALLKALPPQEIDRILKARDERAQVLL